MPNAYIIQFSDHRVFQSYDTQVATWDGDTLIVADAWEYSKTTMKQFKVFINEYTPFEYKSAEDWRHVMNTTPAIARIGEFEYA